MTTSIVTPAGEAALSRFVKVVIAGVVAAAIAFVASPDFANVVSTQYAVILAAVLTPILSALEKYLSQNGATPAAPTAKVAKPVA